jgi:hypothetical protein
MPQVVTRDGRPTVEQLKNIDPLQADGARRERRDAFHLVIPSPPGHGFGKLTETGWDPIRIARAWVVLMGAPGYDATSLRAVTGGLPSRAVGPAEAAGIGGPPPIMPRPFRPRSGRGQAGDLCPRASTTRRGVRDPGPLFATGTATREEMGNRPQTLYAIADFAGRPGGLMLDHDEASYQLIARARRGSRRVHATTSSKRNHYWLTNSAPRRLYWESKPGFDRASSSQSA